MDAATATSALSSIGALGADAAWGSVPGGEAIAKLIDVAAKAASSFTGVEGPTGTQLSLFAAQVTNPAAAPLLISGIIKDWWREDGFAGGTTLPVLLTATQTAGWPAPAQAALAYYWYSLVESLPGKGGWKGKSFWKAKVASIQAGKPTTITIELIGGSKVVKNWTKPATPFKTQLAKNVALHAPAAWSSYPDSEGLAASIGPQPEVSPADLAATAKALTGGDKIGTMMGALLIKGGQVDQLAQLLDAAADQIAQDATVIAGGGAKNETGLVRLEQTGTAEASKGNSALVLLGIAGAIALAGKR